MKKLHLALLFCGGSIGWVANAYVDTVDAPAERLVPYIQSLVHELARRAGSRKKSEHAR